MKKLISLLLLFSLLLTTAAIVDIGAVHAAGELALQVGDNISVYADGTISVLSTIPDYNTDYKLYLNDIEVENLTFTQINAPSPDYTGYWIDGTVPSGIYIGENTLKLTDGSSGVEKNVTLKRSENGRTYMQYDGGDTAAARAIDNVTYSSGNPIVEAGTDDDSDYGNIIKFKEFGVSEGGYAQIDRTNKLPDGSTSDNNLMNNGNGMHSGIIDISFDYKTNIENLRLQINTSYSKWTDAYFNKAYYSPEAGSGGAGYVQFFNSSRYFGAGGYGNVGQYDVGAWNSGVLRIDLNSKTYVILNNGAPQRYGKFSVLNGLTSFRLIPDCGSGHAAGSYLYFDNISVTGGENFTDAESVVLKYNDGRSETYSNAALNSFGVTSISVPLTPGVSVDVSNVSLVDENGDIVPASVTAENDAAVITPETDMLASGRYYIVFDEVTYNGQTHVVPSGIPFEVDCSPSIVYPVNGETIEVNSSSDTLKMKVIVPPGYISAGVLFDGELFKEIAVEDNKAAYEIEGIIPESASIGESHTLSLITSDSDGNDSTESVNVSFKRNGKLIYFMNDGDTADIPAGAITGGNITAGIPSIIGKITAEDWQPTAPEDLVHGKVLQVSTDSDAGVSLSNKLLMQLDSYTTNSNAADYFDANSGICELVFDYKSNIATQIRVATRNGLASQNSGSYNFNPYYVIFDSANSDNKWNTFKIKYDFNTKSFEVYHKIDDASSNEFAFVTGGTYQKFPKFTAFRMEVYSTGTTLAKGEYFYIDNIRVEGAVKFPGCEEVVFTDGGGNVISPDINGKADSYELKKINIYVSNEIENTENNLFFEQADGASVDADVTYKTAKVSETENKYIITVEPGELLKDGDYNLFIGKDVTYRGESYGIKTKIPFSIKCRDVQIIAPENAAQIENTETVSLSAFVKNASNIKFAVGSAGGEQVVKEFTADDCGEYKEYSYVCDMTQESVKNISDDGDVYFKVIYNGENASRAFRFIYDWTAAEWITKIKTFPSQTDKDAFLASMAADLNILGNELYTTGSGQSIINLICETVSAASIATLKDLREYVQKILVLSAYNTGNEKVVEGGTLQYADALGLVDTEGKAIGLYEEYLNDLSSEGMNSVNKGLLGRNFITAEDFKAKMNELVLYHAMVDNKKFGGGHVEKLITKYSTEYAKAGFDISAYNMLDNKNTFGIIFANSAAATLALLKDEFNSLCKNPPSAGGNDARPSVPSGRFGGGGGAAFYTTSPADNTLPGGNGAFNDISSAPWAETAITTLYKKGIISGRGDGSFGCNDTVTRAEFVKMIVLALDIPDTDGNVKYDDVLETDWFADYIRRAALKGLIKGSNGLFNPNEIITRQDAAVIIFRGLPSLEKGDAQFNDKDDIADYALEATGALAKEKLIKGMGNNLFSPLTSLTRAQAAQLVYNILMRGLIK